MKSVTPHFPACYIYVTIREAYGMIRRLIEWDEQCGGARRRHISYWQFDCCLFPLFILFEFICNLSLCIVFPYQKKKKKKSPVNFTFTAIPKSFQFLFRRSKPCMMMMSTINSLFPLPFLCPVWLSQQSQPGLTFLPCTCQKLPEPLLFLF